MLPGIVIKNGTVIDGSRKAAYQADIIIKGDKIAKIGKINSRLSSFVEIDASGCLVTPGFIDFHAHSGLHLFNDPLSKEKVRQGITTEVLGSCGFSTVPLTDKNINELAVYAKPVLGQTKCEIKWRTLKDYYKKLRDTGISVNVVTNVGHNTLRTAVMGFDARHSTPKEIKIMKTLLKKALEEGAVGLSTGFLYVPGYYAQQEEIVALCRLVAENNGYYATHMRNESNAIKDAIKESLEIGKKTNVHVHISHLKVVGRDNWGKSEEILKMLDGARERGIRITCDVYPYLAGSTTIAALFPPWVLEGGIEVAVKKLREPKVRDAVKKQWKNSSTEWENLVNCCNWTNILISALDSPKNKQYEGKSIKQISEELGRDPADIALDFLIQEKGDVTIIIFAVAEEDMVNILKYPFSCIGTDGLYGGQKPHPRLCGTFPKVLGTYVREKGILGWEEAIYKMTRLPASILGISSIGQIRENCLADLVIFDPDIIIDRATYNEPWTPPIGIEYVIISGKIVLRKGEFTGECPGKILIKNKGNTN